MQSLRAGRCAGSSTTVRRTLTPDTVHVRHQNGQLRRLSLHPCTPRSTDSSTMILLHRPLGQRSQRQPHVGLNTAEPALNQAPRLGRAQHNTHTGTTVLVSIPPALLRLAARLLQPLLHGYPWQCR